MAHSKSREELATCGGSNVVKVWNEATKRTKYTLIGIASEDISMVKSHYIHIHMHNKLLLNLYFNIVEVLKNTSRIRDYG